MATIVHPFLCFQPSHPNRTCSCSSVPSIPTLASRFLSLRKNPLRGFHSCSGTKLTLKINPLVPNAKEETIADTNSQVSQKKAERNKILSSSSFTEIVASLFYGFRNVLKFDELGLEILSIALPAVLAIAADPLTSLVDSAYIGHVGSVELAAVGVSISVFNLVAKLFNIPLLNITTSFVAEEQAKIRDGDYSSVTVEKSDSNLGFAPGGQELMHDKQSKKLLPAVSASLALAAGIGIAEAVALSIGSGSLMNIMGVPVDSPMHLPAEQFLTLRAFGAPAVVIALAAQGTFRGFMDTKTPLYAVGAGNLLNAILDPILIFSFGLGVGGAAISTVISEYLIAFILLWKLNAKVILLPQNIDGKGIARYLQSGSLLIGRTIAVLMTMTLGTSMAARQGHVDMAAHQICLQIWFALSLLTDALALAGQALLARFYTQGDYKLAQRVIYRILQMGGVIGIALAVILFLGFGTFSGLFSTDSDVLGVAHAEVLFVAGSQPVVSLAFVFDGLYYGVSDFVFAAYSMGVAGLISSVFLLVSAPIFRLDGIWLGLCLFMILRVVAGVWRLGTKSGPWKVIWSEMETELLDK